MAEDPAAVGVDRGDPDAAPLRLVDERVRRVEAHRLLVQQRAEELGAVVDPQPGRLVGEQAEGGRVGLREAEAGEALDLVPDPFGDLLGDAVGGGAGEEAAVMLVDRLLGALAAHRPPQPLRLGGGKAGERHRHLDHLLLEDDRPQRLLQHRLQQRVLVGDLVVGVLAAELAPLYIGMDGAALDRAGRTSATWTMTSSRSRGWVRGSICICARLSIWKTPVVSAARIDSKVSGRRAGSARGRAARRGRGRSPRRSARPRPRGVSTTHSHPHPPKSSFACVSQHPSPRQSVIAI